LNTATPANVNPSALAAGNFTFNSRFAGQYFDKASGLHYNHHRDYDPTLGRYVQSDPIGLEGGINTYLYVGADPNFGVDPDGQQATMPRISIPAWVPRTPIPAWVAPAAGGAAAAVGVFSVAYSAGTVINDRFGMQIADAIDWCANKESDRCRKVFDICIEDCTETELPTRDHDASYRKCLNRCMVDNDCKPPSAGGW
jgi:RHS repeat-associated protein